MAFGRYINFVAAVLNKGGWLIGGWLLVSVSFGQTPPTASTVATGKYLVVLTTKTGTPYTTAQPGQFLSQRAITRRQRQGIAVTERDLPVNPAWVSQIRQTGAIVWFTSRWLNAVLIETTPKGLQTVLALPFVKGLESTRPLNRARIGASEKTMGKFGAVDSLAYGPSGTQLSQIGVDQMHRQGYHGEGMLVGILDAGFRRADSVAFLKPLFAENRIVGTYDFVAKERNVYDDDDHGLHVLSIMAAAAPGQLYGAAYKASYLLLRTEDALSETRIEEANWLLGAEYADSAGVDVINSSLNYFQFDNPASDYVQSDMDGKTALSTRAAQWATETGMVVVISAGNEGANAWRTIGAPADAVSVLAVAAVNFNGVRASFSSFGPSADGRVKPDLAAQGVGTIIGTTTGRISAENGTTCAAPLVAGLATGFWQAFPALTAAQVTALLRRSGSQFIRPDEALGYGIPTFTWAAELVNSTDQFIAYPNPFTDTDAVSARWLGLSPGTPVEAMLSDLTGRVLWRQQFLNEAQLPFTFQSLRLSAGLYLLTLTADNRRQVVKLLKR